MNSILIKTRTKPDIQLINLNNLTAQFEFRATRQMFGQQITASIVNQQQNIGYV